MIYATVNGGYFHNSIGCTVVVSNRGATYLEIDATIAMLKGLTLCPVCAMNGPDKMQSKWDNPRCLHPSIRDNRECAVCGAEIPVWQMVSLSKRASEAREMLRSGNRSLYLTHKDVVFDEMADVGDKLRG